MNDDFRKAIARSQSISAQNQANAAANNLGSELSNIASKQKDNGNFFTNLIGGIGQKINDVGGAIGTTLNAAGSLITNPLANNKIKSANEDASNKRNEIAKKYGYNSYSDAMNDDSFWSKAKDELDSINDSQKSNLKTAETINNATNLQNVNRNEFAGQALSTLGTVAGLAGGGAASVVAGNVLGGALEGAGDAFKTAAQKGDSLSDLDANELTARVLAGGASAAAGSAVGGKLASKGANTITNAALRGAATGAVSGATSGAIMSGITDQNLIEGALSGAVSGAQGGAIMGGANAAANKALATGINKRSAKMGNDDLINTHNNDSTYEKQAKKSLKKTATAQREMTDADRLKVQDDYERIRNQRNVAGVQRDIGFQEVGARREGSKAITDSWGDLNDSGLDTAQDMALVSKRLTTGDGTFSKMSRSVLADSGAIDVKGDGGLSEATIKRLAQQAHLSGKDLDKAIANVNSTLEGYKTSDNSLTSTINGRMDLLDADDARKSFEQLARDTRKASGSSTEATPYSKFYSAVAKTMSDQIDDATAENYQKYINNPENVNKLLAGVEELYPEYAQNLRRQLANTSVQSESRSLVADLVNVGNAVEKSKRTATSAPSVNGTTFNGNLKEDMINNPTADPRKVGGKVIKAGLKTLLGNEDEVKKYSQEMAAKQAQLDSGLVEDTVKQGLGTRAKNFASNRLTDATNLNNWLNSMDANQLGEVAGSALYTTGNRLGNRLSNETVANTAMQNQAAADANAQNQADAQTLMQDFANTYGQDTLESVLSNTGLADNATLASALSGVSAPSMAQTAYGQTLAAAQTADTASSNPMTAQLENQMQMLQNGMQNAMAAGDFTSYAKIMDLYNNAYKMYSTIQSAEAKNTTSSASKLSDTQKKALAARSQLAQLSSLNPTGRSMLPDWLRNLTGGDEYTSAASQLASTIGYMQSGANVSESEKAAIRTNYIPQATDSAEVRARKLQAAQQLLNDYLAGTEYAQ